MNLLKKIFGSKEPTVCSYEDFWRWFKIHEEQFYHVIKSNKDIEKNFFAKLSPQLGKLKDGFFYLTGMLTPQTVELIFTADGDLKNIAYVEELVDSAPKIYGWSFTAHKPATDIEKINIRMNQYVFNKSNMSFYPNDRPGYPDEIDITVVHENFKEDITTITNGVYIFLDNYLGEMNFLSSIDNVNVIAREDAEKELIPIEKLKAFLEWRQKEFTEKYEAIRHHTENDKYSVLEASLENGDKLVAVVNDDLLHWDSKASHPWIATLEIKYNSNNGGMPDSTTNAVLDGIETNLMMELRDEEGYLNIGRQTAQNFREIYFACKDFRKPSKLFFEIKEKHGDQFEITYSLYKDKYWRSFDRFINPQM
jgi:hypothetical protein